MKYWLIVCEALKMPPKVKPAQPSKKTVEKKKEKIIEVNISDSRCSWQRVNHYTQPVSSF